MYACTYVSKHMHVQMRVRTTSDICRMIFSLFSMAPAAHSWNCSAQSPPCSMNRLRECTSASSVCVGGGHAGGRAGGAKYTGYTT